MHEDWLLRTLKLARNREGFCSPNPAVGAVVVKNNRLISEGYHEGPGHPHAEVMALHSLGDKAKGADLYVSLEPCCHHGRTPPCTDLIIRSGIKRVFFGLMDPNPIVAGKGAKILNAAGISCEYILVPEINDFYRAYRFWTLNNKPFVTAKIAMTRDGFVAHADRSPMKITGEACRIYTHKHRMASDAILTTINTVLADNPKMNVRLDDQVIKKPVYLLDTTARLPLTAEIFKAAHPITLFHVDVLDPMYTLALQKKGVRCVPIALYENNLNLSEVLELIGKDGVHALWVESGPTCFNAFLKQALLQCAIVYQTNTTWQTKGLPANIDQSLLTQSTQYTAEVIGDAAVSTYFYD